MVIKEAWLNKTHSVIVLYVVETIDLIPEYFAEWLTISWKLSIFLVSP